jgi:hypothetical protein
MNDQERKKKREREREKERDRDREKQRKKERVGFDLVRDTRRIKNSLYFSLYL